MSRKDRGIEITKRQKAALEQLVLSRTIAIKYQQRAHILLGLSARKTCQQLSNEICIDRLTARKWQKKWKEVQEQLAALEQGVNKHQYQLALLAILSDAPRSATLIKFTPEQARQMRVVSQETPGQSGYTVSRWNNRLLAKEVIKRGIVDSISTVGLGFLLKSSGG